MVMRQTLAVVVCAAGFAAAGFGQTPTITAVQDAGEYTANVAAGSVFVVKGTNLSAAGYTPAAGLPLANTLNGVKITFTRLNVQTTVDAFMVYTYNLNGVNQLAAVLPSSTVAAEYNVTVTNGSATSANFRATVAPRKFRVITQDSTGTGNAVVQNYISQTQLDLGRLTTGTLAGTTFTHSPAKPGQVIIIWGTGMGALSGIADNVAPGAVDFRSQTPIVVTVGGVNVNPDYAGRAPSLPGTDQINLTLPANVPTGCAVPLQVSVGGQLSNPATIAIAPQGSDACSSPTYSKETLQKLDAGGTIAAGAFTLTSFATSLSVPGFGSVNATVEAAAGAFSRYSGAQIGTASSFTNPAGTCTVFRRLGDQTDLLLGPSATTLDAGASLTLSGPNVKPTANTLQREAGNQYSLTLGTSVSGLPFPVPGYTDPPVVAAGTYQLRGTGGADVGPFEASLTIGSKINVATLPQTVNRSAGVTVTWTGGGANDLVNVVGYSGARAGGTTNDPIYDAGVFLCTVQANAGRLTVPASVLNQLPVTPADALTAGTGIGVIAVLGSSTPSPGNGLFTAPLRAGGNTDASVFVATVGSLTSTTYQ